MNCRYCHGEAESGRVIALIPLEIPDGENSIGCKPCMIERGLWCFVHGMPHQRWNSGGHLCLICHSQLFAHLRERAPSYYRFLLEALPQHNAEALRSWAQEPNNWLPSSISSAAELVLWSLSAQALIQNLPLQTVLTQVAERADLEAVIPVAFPVSIP